ncbi:MAG: N-acetyltransferase [Piscinibacter sp.]|nr:N-acetyltransferase [Piscinibacter sp.]
MRRGVVRVIDDIALIDAVAWNALVDAQPSATPFVRHEYLLALQASGSACDETGWSTRFVCIFDDADIPARPGARLLAACPLYLKAHSYGEYVFDWAWADAYRRHGLAYYPKLLGAVPFTPVTGPRLLATDDAQRDALLSAIGRLVREAGLSSAHLLFLDEADQRAAARAGWMARSTVQFHWRNRAPLPYADFDDFLAGLQRDKRRKIAQERRKVAEAGVGFRALRGPEIDGADWDFFYRCYELTYAAHHSTPYLTRDFFARAAATMPENWLLFVAERGGQRIASSLIAIDPQRGHAFGRYWGATEPIDCLHFEACYYQPLSWCIEHGFQRFEGGAQGEHKMARGLVPVATASAHRLADTRFAGAVAEFLRREGRAVEDYLGELEQRTPFKTAGS